MFRGSFSHKEKTIISIRTFTEKSQHDLNTVNLMIFEEVESGKVHDTIDPRILQKGDNCVRGK